MDLGTHMKDHGKGMVLKITGEVDVYTVSQLKQELMPLVEKEDHEVTVDLSQVQYMDSTGLGVFIEALKSSEKHGGTIRLVNPRPRIERLFDITGLSEVMLVKQKEETE